MSADDIVTAQIPNLNLASAGILKKKEGSETELIPLLESDEAAMQIDSSRLAFMPDVAGMLNSYKPGGEKLILAARIRGTVKTAFPEGKPKPKTEDPDKEKKNDQSEESPHRNIWRLQKNL